MDGCFGCVQKILADNEQKQKAIEMAQRTANETGEWWGVYQDGGTWFAVPARLQSKYPIQEYFSPELQYAHP